MSSPRTAPGPPKAAPSKSASGRRGEKPAIGRQGEKAAPVKVSKVSKGPKTPKSALPKAQPPKPPSNRAERTAERREAIIEAALDEFISRGFTATRIDDVARRAGVAEGPRFPSIADFYYREVVSRGLAGMRALIELAVSRGEIQQKNLARFPQILVAPAIIAVIWQSLFSRHAPLDAIEMFRVHLDLIFGERRTT